MIQRFRTYMRENLHDPMLMLYKRLLIDPPCVALKKEPTELKNRYQRPQARLINRKTLPQRSRKNENLQSARPNLSREIRASKSHLFQVVCSLARTRGMYIYIYISVVFSLLHRSRLPFVCMACIMHSNVYDQNKFNVRKM